MMPSPLLNSNSSNTVKSAQRKMNDGTLGAESFLFSMKTVLATEVECIMFQASMCRMRHTLLSPGNPTSVNLHRLSGSTGLNQVHGDASTMTDNISGRHEVKKKESIPVRIAGDLDGGVLDGHLHSPVGVWRSVGVPKLTKHTSSSNIEVSVSLPHHSFSEEGVLSYRQRQQPLQELLDGMALLVQQATSFVDVALDADCGDGPYGWLALQEHWRRGFSCGPSMIHAGCGGTLASCHFLDIAGVELVDPLSADIHSSAVTTLLQSEIKIALKSAFGNLEGPLCVTDWCKGHIQSGDGATTCDGSSGESNLSECKDSSAVTLSVGEPMSPVLSSAAGSSSLKASSTPDGAKVFPCSFLSMLSGISKHLFGAYPALFFLVILAGHQSCSARKNSTVYCAPSCGNIHISYPFRLSTDPNSCGNKKYELTCENNRPALYLNETVKYYVQAIDYSNFTIRLVDADVQKDDCFSIPRHSLISDYYFPYYSDRGFTNNSIGYTYVTISTFIFMSCPNPIPSSPNYIIVDASSCKNGSTLFNSTSNISSPSSQNYSYVFIASSDYYDSIGYHRLRDIPNSCRVNLMYPASFTFDQPTNETNIISYKDVHDSIVYGFDLSWSWACCYFPKENPCKLDEATINDYCGIDIDDLRSGGGPIRIAIGFLTNRILRYLVVILVWPVNKYLPSYDWIVYRSWGQPRLEFNFYSNGVRAIGGKDITKTISSDALSMLIILIITLLVLLELFAIYHTLLFLCGLPCLITLLIYKWRRRHLSMYGNIEEFLQSHDHNLTLIRYSYSEIKKITHGFNDKLGEGGYGSVYKGKLRSGRSAAVKILCKEKANGQDFINEVATIGRIHHCNVVQLIGFTVEGSKRVLIYEFMPNGSLEKYIFSRQGSIPLSNQKIYEISLGVARGIEYLHEGCDMQILHFDIKPHNILLDENFTPKVSDFGLAKLYPTNKSVVSLTMARGTMGYMAPELFYKSIGGVSYKADVYSFGMLLMEMVGRRKNLNALADHSSQMYFPSWIYDQVNEGRDILEDQATEQEKNTIKR